FSFLQHAKVKSRSVMRYEQGWHASFIQADADAVARHARLGYFEHCITNPVSITDADFFIRKSCNGEIFSELSETEIIASQEALPVPVGIHLVDENGALFSTVTSEIGLRVAIDMKLAHHPSPLDRELPDRRSHGLAGPCDVAWKTDI